MASAAPASKSMFNIDNNRKTLLFNRMTKQYSGTVVIDDCVHKRIQPTIVKSARYVNSQMGAPGFPIRVDHETWRHYL